MGAESVQVAADDDADDAWTAATRCVLAMTAGRGVACPCLLLVGRVTV
jgi:hypothetical protein